jgi:small-conductance mechanosensitive channel
VSRTYWTLAALYAVTIIATAIGVMVTERQLSLVIIWTGAAVLIGLYIALLRVGRRDRAAREALAADPDPWAEAVAAARDLPTAELLVMHDDMVRHANAASPLLLDRLLRPVIEDEMAKRSIPLCRCGAPQPGGIHTRTCQETS